MLETMAYNQLIEVIVGIITDQYDIRLGIRFVGLGRFIVVYRNTETGTTHNITAERQTLTDIVSGHTYAFIDRSIQEALGTPQNEDGEQ